MTYTEWLEKELNIYKRENKLLKDKYENLTTMFNEVHDNELETRYKKNEFLKWAYSLENENKILQQQIEGLQNELFTQQLNEDEADSLIKDFRKQNIELMEYLDTSRIQYNKIFKENKKLQQQTKKLSFENVRLQNELFTQQMNEDEADDKIYELEKDNQAIHSIWKKSMEREEKHKQEKQQLKNELFNAYLIHQHNSNLISELKLSLSSYNNFVDEMFPE